MRVTRTNNIKFLSCVIITMEPVDKTLKIQLHSQLVKYAVYISWFVVTLFVHNIGETQQNIFI